MPRTLLAPLVCACAAVMFAPLARAQAQLAYDIVATHPHDASAFTQGLAYAHGKLYESTGRYGRSGTWLKTIAGGAVLRHVPLAKELFGEGLALHDRQIVQLTWKNGRAFVYDEKLRRTGEFHYDGEGWGLAWDGARWLMSDGSADIVARSAQDFSELSRITVHAGAQRVGQLNELEFAQGRLWSNIWHSDLVAQIDPASGAVLGWLDLSALKRGFAKPAGWDEEEHVLNGIAFNPDSGHFYVTGKCWPVLYEIRVREPR